MEDTGYKMHGGEAETHIEYKGETEKWTNRFTIYKQDQIAALSVATRGPPAQYTNSGYS